MTAINRRKTLLLVAAFFIPFILSATGVIGRLEIDIQWKESEPSKRYVPNFENPEGWELAMVYVGSSNCAPSNVDYLPSAVKKLKRRLRKRAESAGYSFATIGVARDWKVDEGINHLHKFGTFDAITSGRNWLNYGVIRFMYTRYPGEAGTPQVVVVSRQVKTVKDDGIYAIAKGRQLARKVGSEMIRDWANTGRKLLPTLEDRNDPPIRSSR